MDWQVTYFGVMLAKELATDRAYALLDRYGLESWSAGGCAVLAEALHRMLGLVRYALVDPDRIMPGDEHLLQVTYAAEHFVVRVQNAYVDSDGAYTKNGMIQKLAALEGQESVMRKVNARFWAQVGPGKDIPLPEGAVEELMVLLEDLVENVYLG